MGRILDLFSALIDNDLDLDNLEKQCYLVNTMSSHSLKQLMREFLEENDTYDGAVELLKIQFKRNQAIFRHLMSRFRLAHQSEETQDSLDEYVCRGKSLLATFSQCNRLTAAQILCSHLEDGLHPNSMAAWRNKTADHSEVPTCAELFSFLNKHASKLYVPESSKDHHQHQRHERSE